MSKIWSPSVTIFALSALICFEVAAADEVKARVCSQAATSPATLKLTAPEPKEKAALAEYIKTQATSADLTDGKIADQKVLFMGEYHPDLKARPYMISQLEGLKRLGFNVFALEMFNSADQPLLDSYAEGKVARSVVFDRLKEKWGWHPEQYLSMIDHAIKLKFKILALDDRTLGPERLRDVHMAKVMTDYLTAHPEARIVGYMGGIHASNSAQKPQRRALEEAGFSTIGFMLDFKGSINRNEDDWFPNESTDALVGDTFDTTGISTSVFVPFPLNHWYAFDGYIFQP